MKLVESYNIKDFYISSVCFYEIDVFILKQRRAAKVICKCEGFKEGLLDLTYQDFQAQISCQNSSSVHIPYSLLWEYMLNGVLRNSLSSISDLGIYSIKSIYALDEKVPNRITFI